MSNGKRWLAWNTHAHGAARLSFSARNRCGDEGEAAVRKGRPHPKRRRKQEER